jgi:predicted O-methyltransferase YrrM
MFTRVAALDALLISLDLPPELYTGGYTRWQEKLYATFGREQQRVELLRADSHDARTVDLVRKTTGGRPLDFLLIDGDHSYEGVKRDFELYAPLVAPGGYIAFHDIVPGPEARVGGVPRFWQELKQTRPVTEFVNDWKQGAYGIGVIQVPKN